MPRRRRGAAIGSTPARAGTTRRAASRHGQRRVYPRSRGDHVRRDRCAVHGERSTPARAGTTCRSTSATSTTVYPRSRGDHRHAGAAATRPGLPPLARGPPRRSARRARERRGLPPLARGPLRPRSRDAVARAVYPRSRGDHGHVDATRHGARVYPRSRGDHCRVPVRDAASRGGLPPLARGPPGQLRRARSR